MATIHITEAELARDVHEVLARVQQGLEVVIEQDQNAIAVLRPAVMKGRPLSECIAIAEARQAAAVPDEGFMEDVAKGIAERSKPWLPPSWE
jgi:antitoxin (DNA-binding transcriptional repressor) of toxin-antitoxin stability system